MSFKLSTKIISGFGFIIVLFTGMGFFTMSRLGTARKITANVSEFAVPRLAGAASMERLATQIRTATNRYCATLNEDDAATVEKTVATLQQTIKQTKEKQGGVDEFLTQLETAEKNVVSFTVSFTDLKQKVADMQDCLSTMRETETTFYEYYDALKQAHVTAILASNNAADSREKLQQLFDIYAQSSQAVKDVTRAYSISDPRLMESAVKRFNAIKQLLAQVGAPQGMQKKQGEDSGVQVSSSKDMFSQTVAQVGVFRGSIEMFVMTWKASEDSKRLCAQNADSLSLFAQDLAARSLDMTSHEADATTAILLSVSKVNRWMMPAVTVVGISLAILLAIMISRPVARIVANVGQSSQELGHTSEELTSTSQTLSDQSTRQAASLEETSAALEEISSMAKLNSEKATHAREISTETSLRAKQSMEEMEKMNRAMQEISKTIHVIDEIALQTRLLSINASVEAVRAGGAGQGFGVVADEIRKLAQRSATAAQEVNSTVSNGVKITASVANNLSHVIAQFQSVDAIVGEIAAASREQSVGVEQVNGAVIEMEKATQSSARVAENNTNSSFDLNAQSQHLQKAVFDLASLVWGKERKNEEANRKTRGGDEIE